MINITSTEAEKKLQKLVGKTVQIKISSPALFVFFNGNSESCDSNLYTTEAWKIFQNEKLILNNEATNKPTEQVIAGKIKDLKLTSISVDHSGLLFGLENDLTIKISNTGKPRTWEVRLKKDESFLAATGDGKFTQATYKNSQID